MQACKTWSIVFLPALMLCFAARAQEPAPVQCWEIVSPAATAAPYSPILLNRCTGKTWLLTRADTQEAKSTSPGAFAYRWKPITTDDTGEATFPSSPR